MKLGPPHRTLGKRGGRAAAAVASVALASTALIAVATSPAAAATGCSVSYTVSSQWNVGFSTNLVITNLGSAVSSWTLAWTFPGNQQVTQLWNGNYTQTGESVSVTNESYNGSIATNGTVSLGFNGSYSGTNASPAQFTVNGVVCTGSASGTSTPTPTPTTASPTPTTSPTTSPTPTPTSASPSPTGTGGGTGTRVANPFLNASPYLNPNYVSEVDTQAASDGNSAAEEQVGDYQTAIWMDHIGAIAGDSTHLGLQAQLNDAEAQSKGSSEPVLFEVVIYDLPGRDCAALASNGEIPATAAGLTEYEQQYINPIAALLGNSAYSNLRIVAVIEPDSLPNVVTNQSLSACATATPYYESGIEYALNALHAIPNVYNYMDIAHSAWLGWPNNLSGAVTVYNNVIKATTAGYASINGFISDTANYTPTQEPFLTNPTMQVGGQQLDSVQFYQFNPTFDELTYDTDMYNALVAGGFPSADKFIIDTSRNGWGGSARPTALNSSPTTAAAYVAANKIDQRSFRGDWCNQNGAGIGARPQANPFGTSSPIEAFVWVKPPGESDGDYPTATHSHGDPHCDPSSTNTDGSGNTYPTGSIPGFDVPAGQWFPAEFQMLVSNAFPTL